MEELLEKLKLLNYEREFAMPKYRKRTKNNVNTLSEIIVAFHLKVE